MSKQNLALIALVSAAFLSACSTTQKTDAPQASDAAGKPVSTVTPVVADHLNPNSLISTQRSVYFDFDKFDIKANQAAVVERQGKYLAANGALKVRVEGNADERGGREYNLALGQKRAEAVRRALSLQGVSEAQLEAVSFGKEKPAAQGADEEAYSKNRRVEVSYR